MNREKITITAILTVLILATVTMSGYHFIENTMQYETSTPKPADILTTDPGLVTGNGTFLMEEVKVDTKTGENATTRFNLTVGEWDSYRTDVTLTDMTYGAFNHTFQSETNDYNPIDLASDVYLAQGFSSNQTSKYYNYTITNISLYLTNTFTALKSFNIYIYGSNSTGGIGDKLYGPYNFNNGEGIAKWYNITIDTNRPKIDANKTYYAIIGDVSSGGLQWRYFNNSINEGFKIYRNGSSYWESLDHGDEFLGLKMGLDPITPLNQTQIEEIYGTANGIPNPLNYKNYLSYVEDGKATYVTGQHYDVENITFVFSENIDFNWSATSILTQSNTSDTQYARYEISPAFEGNAGGLARWTLRGNASVPNGNALLIRTPDDWEYVSVFEGTTNITLDLDSDTSDDVWFQNSPMGIILNMSKSEYTFNITATDIEILDNFWDLRANNKERELQMSVTSTQAGTATLYLYNGSTLKFTDTKTMGIPGGFLFDKHNLTLDTTYTAVVVFESTANNYAHALKRTVLYSLGTNGEDDEDDDDNGTTPPADPPGIDFMTIFIIVLAIIIAGLGIFILLKRKSPKRSIEKLSAGDIEFPDTKDDPKPRLTIQPRRDKEGMKPRTPKMSAFSVPSAQELTPEEQEEMERTESEMDIEKNKFICVVHKGTIDGAVYICPKCQTFYCVKCANVLKDKGEKCWSCGNEITIAVSDSKTLTPPPLPPRIEGLSPQLQKEIQPLEEEIASYNRLIQKLDIKFSAGGISQEEYMKEKISLSEKLGSLMGRIDKLQEKNS